MAVYSVHFDLNGSDKDYAGLQEIIKNCKTDWWYYLDLTWLASASLRAKAIYEN
tara:strand:- start:3093 stop:3254 length:162 start_codon:yes stop_codon:yes gene_type:complete